MLLTKTQVLQSSILSEKNLKKCTSFEKQKGASYIHRNIYFGIIVFSYLSSTNSCLRFLLICFALEIKRFYQSFLGNEVDLAKNWNLKKHEIRFYRWKSNDYNDMNIFLSLENPCTILLAKENTWRSIFNTNSDLSQNCTEKQIMPFKTTVNLLFNDMWRYHIFPYYFPSPSDYTTLFFYHTILLDFEPDLTLNCS